LTPLYLHPRGSWLHPFPIGSQCSFPALFCSRLFARSLLRYKKNHDCSQTSLKGGATSILGMSVKTRKQTKTKTKKTNKRVSTNQARASDPVCPPNLLADYHLARSEVLPQYYPHARKACVAWHLVCKVPSLQTLRCSILFAFFVSITQRGPVVQIKVKLIHPSAFFIHPNICFSKL